MKFEEEIQQTKPISDERKKAVINVVYTGNKITDLVLASLKPFDINDQHFNVLRILKGRFPNPACPGDIRKVLINKRGDLTRLLDKLEKKGWVDRQTNPDNRRMVDIVLTSKGVQVLDSLNQHFKGAAELEGNLSIEEATVLNQLLDKLRG